MLRSRALTFVVMLTLLPSCSSSDPHPAIGPAVRSISPTGQVALDSQEPMLFAATDRILVADLNSLSSVDPSTLEVDWTVVVPAYAVVEAFGSYWATDFDGSLVRRIDPADGTTLAEIETPGAAPIGAVAVGEELWIAGHHDGRLWRIDPATNEEVGRKKVAFAGDSGPMWLASDGTSVYVDIPRTREVVKVDALTAKVVGRVQMPMGIIPCGQLTIDGATVWATACFESDRAMRVDFETEDYVVTEPMGVNSSGAFVAGDLIWFAGFEPDAVSDDTGVLVAVDRVTGEIVDRVRTGSTTDALVSAFGSIWMPDQDGIARFDPASLVRE
ncbi:MAG TPA: hypothetical protein VLI04_02355 [Nocardioidaceae bacterium]|nr:hypothetical protein [Nocardioidaceae bacterium]